MSPCLCHIRRTHSKFWLRLENEWVTLWFEKWMVWIWVYLPGVEHSWELQNGINFRNSFIYLTLSPRKPHVLPLKVSNALNTPGCFWGQFCRCGILRGWWKVYINPQHIEGSLHKPHNYKWVHKPLARYPDNPCLHAAHFKWLHFVSFIFDPSSSLLPSASLPTLSSLPHIPASIPWPPAS